MRSTKTLLIIYATFHLCMEFLGPQHFIGDIHNLVLFSITKRVFNFHMWFFNLGVNTWVKKIDMILLEWIFFQFWRQFWPMFARTFEIFLPFHMCNYICETWTKFIFQNASANYFKSLDWVVLHKRSSFL